MLPTQREKISSVNQKEAVYSSIILALKENRSPYALSLNLSKQNLNKNYIKRLKELNIVTKNSLYDWALSEKYQEMPIEEIIKTATKKSTVNQSKPKSSLGTRRPSLPRLQESDKPTTNLHALQINFPIREGKIVSPDWEVKEKLNHWLPKYKNLKILGGLTIKNNNNKSLTVFAHSRDIKTLEEVDNLVFKIRLYITEYFIKEGVFFDWDGIKVKNLNLATEDKPAENLTRRGEKFELDLKKKSEKILPLDDINAKAWIDGSPFKFSAETNDKEWKRWYLAMPFAMRDSLNILSRFGIYTEQIKMYGEEIKKHREAIKEMAKMARSVQRFIKRTEKK